MMKKLLALCLALLLCLGMMIPAMAAEVPETYEEAEATISVGTTLSGYANLVEETITLYNKDWFKDDAEPMEDYDLYDHRIIGSEDEITITNEGEDDGYFLWVYVNAYRKDDGKYINLCEPPCVLRTNGEFLTGAFWVDDPAQPRVKLFGGESVTIKASDMLCNGGMTKYADSPNGDLYLITICREYPDGSYYEIGPWAYMINDAKAAEIRATGPIPETPTAPAEEGNPFTDVPVDAYYHDAALWALENGVTTGTTATTFGPTETCTREQVMTFLWRAMGKPILAEQKANPFTDIKESDYSYQAILWASQAGITTGTTTTTFGPKETCTQAQVLTFLWRAFNGGGAPVPEGEPYYALAEDWAELFSLFELTGKDFAPNDPSPRADIVTYIHRVLNALMGVGSDDV